MGGARGPKTRWGLIVILTGVVTVYALVSSAAPEKIHAVWAQPVRFLSDNYDMSCYFRRGAWLPLGKRPYAEVFSEYPQLSTYLFAFTHVLAGSRHNPDWPRVPTGRLDDRLMDQLPWGVPGAFDTYQLVHSLLMVPFYVLLVVSTTHLAHALGVGRPWVWVFGLPAALFFTINRFDVVPAALTTVALVCIVRDRRSSGFACLAVAGLAKWYPIVLVPALIHYCWRRTGRAPVGPVLVGAGIGALVVGHSLWWVGWDALLVPYRFHASRPANVESLYFLTTHYAMGLSGNAALVGAAWLGWVFAVLQFAGVLVGIVACPTDARRLVAVCALSLVLFVCFAKFYSPQWFLWITPLVLALPIRWPARTLLVAMDLTTYAFWIVYDLTYPVSTTTPAAAFVLVVTVNLAIKTALGVVLVAELCHRSAPAHPDEVT